MLNLSARSEWAKVQPTLETHHRGPNSLHYFALSNEVLIRTKDPGNSFESETEDKIGSRSGLIALSVTSF